jgi:hypothetical protein
MLSGAAREIAQPPGDPECIHDLRCAIRHLEQTCESLAAAATSMATAAGRDPAGSVFTAPPAAARATAWRLQNLSQSLRVSADSCRFADQAAKRLR